jgi:hypothetical protein
MEAVQFVPGAMLTLAEVPGLRRRLEYAMRSILETARRISASQDVNSLSSLQPDEFMRIWFCGYCITYTLDVERNSVKILSAARSDRASDGTSAA